MPERFPDAGADDSLLATMLIDGETIYREYLDSDPKIAVSFWDSYKDKITNEHGYSGNQFDAVAERVSDCIDDVDEIDRMY
jgi:hypothetical protein